MLLSALLHLAIPVLSCTLSPDSTTKVPSVVIDQIQFSKPSNEHGTVTLSNNIPQWNGLETDGAIRYLEILVALDTDTGRYYGFDKKKIRRAVTTVIQGLIMYLYRLNIRVVLVGIHQMVGRNITLEQFSKYRSEKFSELPNHDVAILMSYGYQGGIAYVNGVCGRAAVGITGFFPEAPMEYLAVLFHEMAHLFGLAHSDKTKCSCSNDDRSGSCLRIDGFDNECAAQALADKLSEHVCMQSAPNELPESAVPICGNHFVEFGEQCDCGPERFCNSFFCNPATCMRTISNLQFNIILIGILALIAALFLCGHSCTRKQQRRRIYSQNNLNTINTWETPNFKPLVNFASKSPESFLPVWTTAQHTFPRPQDSAPKPSANESLIEQRTANAPPLPPRLFNYVNLAMSEKPENNVLDGKKILVPQRIAPPPPTAVQKPDMNSSNILVSPPPSPPPPPPPPPPSSHSDSLLKNKNAKARLFSALAFEAPSNSDSSEATIYDLPPGFNDFIVKPKTIGESSSKPPAVFQNQSQESSGTSMESRSFKPRPSVPPPNPPVPPRSGKAI